MLICQCVQNGLERGESGEGKRGGRRVTFRRLAAVHAKPEVGVMGEADLAVEKRRSSNAV